MSLLKKDITKNGRIDKFQPELDNGNSKEYKVEIIYDNEVYGNKSEGHLLGFYYLVS